MKGRREGRMEEGKIQTWIKSIWISHVYRNEREHSILPPQEDPLSLKQSFQLKVLKVLFQVDNILMKEMVQREDC